MPEVAFTEDDLRLLRSLGASKGGKVLVQYLNYEVEGYVNEILHCKAEDSATVAHGQAGVQLAKKLLDLLTKDIKQILEQHNIEETQDE